MIERNDFGDEDRTEGETPRHGVNRVELIDVQFQRYDLSASGREAVQVRVDFEPGKVFGSHILAGEKIICVLEGSPQ